MTFQVKIEKLGTGYATCGVKSTPGKRKALCGGPRLEKGLADSRHCRRERFWRHSAGAGRLASLSRASQAPGMG